MIENPPMLTIHRGWQRPDVALIEAFRGAQTSHLVDAMEGRGALDYRIKPLDLGRVLSAARSPGRRIRLISRRCLARCTRRRPAT